MSLGFDAISALPFATSGPDTDVAVVVTGNSLSITIGSVGIIADSVVENLDPNRLTLGTGALTITADANHTVTGSAVSLGLGAFTVNIDTNVTPSGNSLTLATGNVTITADANISPTGNALSLDTVEPGVITWNDIILQTATSGYVEVTLSSGNVNLSLADGDATANGKNLYIKLTGTLSGDATLTMPASTSGGNANRVFFVEDGTTRGGAADSHTIKLLTAGQSASTQVPLPEGAKVLVYSRGSVPATTLAMMEKGFTEVTAASKTTYTAVAGDQIGVDTVANIVTITLPASPAQGDEVTIMDVSASNGFGTNKCVVARNGSNIQGGTSDLDLTTNNQCVTLIFTTATKGWQIKTNSTS